MDLLTTNSKLAKCEAFGYLAMGLELAPGKLGGRGELCPSRGDCYKTCIFSAGFGSIPSVRKARIDRTRFMFETDGSLRREAQALLVVEVDRLQRRAERRKLKPAVRLNTFSDVDWVSMLGKEFFTLLFPDVQFYDYTKDFERWRRALYATVPWPSNYDLTYSCNEHRHIDDSRKLRWAVAESGGRCTVVDRLGGAWHQLIGGEYAGCRIVDGDQHDLTFLHPKGSIIVLAAKGKAGSRNPKPNKFIP